MYRKDVGLIKEHVSNKGSDGLVDVIEFVLCTIQAGLSTVKAQRQDIKDKDIQSKFLWGQKRCGLVYARDNKDFLWSRLQYLLEKGADINKVDGVGWTPLMESIMDEMTQLCGYLVEKGADTTIANQRGVTAPMLVQKFGRQSMMGFFN